MSNANGILSLVLSANSIKDDQTILSSSDVNEILSFIANEKELSSKVYKCLEYLQTKFIKNPDVITSMELTLKENFNLILASTTEMIKVFTMSWLLGLFFKLEMNFAIFLDIYIENLQKESFEIKEEKTNEFKSNFYYFYSIKSEEKFNKILFAYNSIDKKHIAMERILLFVEKIYKIFGDDFVNFIIVLMCQKIKNNSNKFDIEKERSIFKLLYHNFFSFDDKKLINLIHYAFDNNFPISNRKIFLFALLILFISIGSKCFNDMIENFINSPTEIVLAISTADLTIMKENISFLYHYLDTSKTYQHCFECVIGDLVTCEGEEPLIKKEEQKIDKILILQNVLIFFEKVIKLYPNFNELYFKVLLLIIKFFEPYKDNKTKAKYDDAFLRSEKVTQLQSDIKHYEIKYPKISQFITLVNENAKICSSLYIYWYILIFKNFAYFDSYKVFKQFLLNDLSKNNNLMSLLIKLPNELKKFNINIWKKILRSFLVNEKYDSLSNEFNLIKNLKNIFYYELSKTQKTNQNQNNVFDSLTYDYSEIIPFFKENFPIFINFFFSHSMKSSLSNGMDIDEQFDNFMNNKVNETQKAIELDSTDINIKIEILNIYSIIINSFNKDERVSHDIIKFTLDIIDQYVLNTIENNPLIVHIKKTITLLFALYGKVCLSNENSTHPIKILFNKANKHLLIKILKNQNEPQAKMYYKLHQSIYKTLKTFSTENNNESIINDMEDNIIYIIKQMIYKNVDSQKFRNPITVKNMVGLNDIDSTITSNLFIIDVLSLLSKKKQLSFFGFYIRFLTVGSSHKQSKENVIKLINMMLRLKWLPETFRDLIMILTNESGVNKEKIIKFIVDYLKEKSFEIEEENIEERKENEVDVIKRKNKFSVRYKQIIFENIDIIN